MKKLVLFIHGLGGDAAGTWGTFPELMRQDAKLAEQYDVGSFEYQTGFFGRKPSLEIVGGDLKTQIENLHPTCSRAYPVDAYTHQM